MDKWHAQLCWDQNQHWQQSSCARPHRSHYVFFFSIQLSVFGLPFVCSFRTISCLTVLCMHMLDIGSGKSYRTYRISYHVAHLCDVSVLCLRSDVFFISPWEFIARYSLITYFYTFNMRWVAIISRQIMITCGNEYNFDKDATSIWRPIYWNFIFSIYDCREKLFM